MTLCTATDLCACADKSMGIFPDLGMTLLTRQILMNRRLERVGDDCQVVDPVLIPLWQTVRKVLHAMTFEAPFSIVS